MARLVRPVLSLALLCPLLAACVAEPDAALTRRPIINGETDEVHTAVVGLVVLGGEFCTGTVIAPRAVLTAAHCVAGGYDPAATLVFFGTVVGEAGPFRRVSAITYHPDFYTDEVGFVYNDVAVLTLEEDAPVKPMAWQRTPLADPTDRTVTFVGYGVSDGQSQTGSGTRRTVDDVVLAMDENYLWFGNGYSGICFGDSGGPTLLDQGGTLTVVAVSSTVSGRTCVEGSETTRVDIHADFIAPLAPMPVSIEVLRPFEEAFVGRDFGVEVEATSPAGVTEVVLLLDGEPVTSFTAPPYYFDLTAVPAGDHLVGVQATGGDGGRGALDVWVTVITQNAGVHCEADTECSSGRCAEADTGFGFCTQACTTNADCPNDAACAEGVGGRQCGRPGSAAGGCAVGGRTGPAGVGLLLLVGATLAAGRGRGRRGLRRLLGLGVGALALAALLAACGDNRHQYDVDAGYPTRGTRPQNDAAVDAPQRDGGAASGIGAACTAEQSMSQGDCADGLICLTEQLLDGLTKNGYCALQCGQDIGCPWDSTCVPITQRTSMCLLRCTDEAGCRTAEGYHCTMLPASQVCWSWIVPPGTNDGAACSEPDGGPFVDEADRIFGPSQQLFAPDGGIVEAQTQVVAKGSTVVATYASFASQWGGGRVAVSASQDQGTTFGPAVVVRDTLTSRKSDPVLAVDATGSHHYLAWLGYDRTGGGMSNMRVLVARSDDGGQTWPDAQIVDATTSDSGTGTMARPWIATGSLGTVYITYVLGTGAASTIKVARSSDEGVTWDAPIRVDDPSRTPTARGLPRVATNAAGDVFVAWGEVGADEPNGDSANDIYVARWDAGTTWGTFGANVKGNADADQVVSNGLAVVPSIATGGDKVYLVYVAGTPDMMRWDIRMTWSDDNGDTFTAAAIKINDDATCGIHVLPAAAVDAQDRLHVAWYDNRFGTEAAAFFCGSWDPALSTIGANEFVSDATFAYGTDNRATNRLGNNAGLAVDGTSIYATWADPRGVTATSHIRFASGTLP